MKTLRLLFFTIIINQLSIIICHAQTPPCYTDQIWAEIVRKDSSLLVQRNVMDQAIAQKSKGKYDTQRFSERSAGNPTVIPTVIYIVNDSTPTSNISMQQIQSQMDQLNATYSGYGYQFCYAKINMLDSNLLVHQPGDSAGVFRITSPLTNLDENTQDAALKSLSPLPWQNYLRIFVVKSISPNGVLGYAYLPGSATTQDGIVMRADVFGSRNYCSACSLLSDYDLGASLIHEAGHYLNLYHTFQGGCYETADTSQYACLVYGDRVCDTPPTVGSFGCPSPSPLSCDSTNHELVQNFMDYTTDHCKSSFTAGQNMRMDNSIYAYRSTLVSTQNLINTGITCISLNGLYATFNCVNYDGCLNDTMVFTSLNATGFTYHWDFGDGDTANGVNGYHAYRNTGQYQVTLTATNTAAHISESLGTPVFITECHPIACGYNRWEFTYGYLDFSSGTPVATSHTNAIPQYTFGVYYDNYFRGDSTGRPLFNIDYKYIDYVCDTSFNIVDHINSSAHGLLLPCPSGSNKYCYIDHGNPNTKKLNFTILQAANGSASILPGKREVNIPVPDTTAFSIWQLRGIPNCDGTKFWIIECIQNSTIAIYELNSNDTIVFHQLYPIHGLSNNIYTVAVSPDGRKIVLTVFNTPTSNDIGFYVLDFNKSTGMITSNKYLDEGTFAYPHSGGYGSGGFFSPNSRFFYNQGGCCNLQRDIGYINQYDLYSADPVANRKPIWQFQVGGEYSSGWYTFMNQGPDKKIYMGYEWGGWDHTHNFRLAVINYPDVTENGLNSTGFNEKGPLIFPADNPGAFDYDVGFNFFGDITNTFGCGWQPGVPQPFNYFATGCTGYQFLSDDCYAHTWNFGDVQSGAADTSTLNYPVHNYSAPGVYIVTLNSNGYIFKDTISIVAPQLQLATSGLTGCHGDIHGNYSVATIQPGVNYSWSVDNGSPAYVASATNIDVYWDTTGHSSGQVKVIAFNSLTGCTDSTTMYVNWAGPNCDGKVTGISKPEEGELRVLLYPNPFSVTSVRLAVSSELIGAKLEVYDDNGRMVWNSELRTQNSELTLNVSRGVYWLRIYSPAFSIVKKLVKL